MPASNRERRISTFLVAAQNILHNPYVRFLLAFLRRKWDELFSLSRQELSDIFLC